MQVPEIFCSVFPETPSTIPVHRKITIFALPLEPGFLKRFSDKTELTLNGKFFEQAIVLIFLSSIIKKMQENNLFDSYPTRRFWMSLTSMNTTRCQVKICTQAKQQKLQIDLYKKLSFHHLYHYNKNGIQATYHQHAPGRS